MSNEKNVSPEAMRLMRETLINEMNKKQLEVINFLKTIPIPVQYFTQAFVFIDTGILWAKEVLSHAPIATPCDPSEVTELTATLEDEAANAA